LRLSSPGGKLRPREREKPVGREKKRRLRRLYDHAKKNNCVHELLKRRQGTGKKGV